MSAAVILDSTPPGILCHPRQPPHVVACRQWLRALLNAGHRVVLPEIADYEVRREFVRIGSTASVSNLDTYGAQLEYLPLTTAVMRRAAELWAQARNAGVQTAPDPALDCDVILPAQALSLGVPVVVATGNAAYLSRFVQAADWATITP